MRSLRQTGDTIVEVLIALTVVASMLGGAYATSTRSLRNNRQAQERGEALKLAESQLERLKALISTGSTAPFTVANSFCIDTSNDLKTATPAVCSVTTGGPIYYATVQRQANDRFSVSVTWDRAGGGGNDTIGMSYRVHPADNTFAVADPTPPPLPDLCPNINGSQTAIPAGMIQDAGGNCVTPPPPDVCPNIAGAQASIPSGLIKDASGNCVTPPPAAPPVTFAFTSTRQTYVVPAGVSRITIEAWGAEGAARFFASSGDPAGLGGYQRGTMNVTPGQVLCVVVGGQGVNTSGGYNGGAGGDGGGGGGASDVRNGVCTSPGDSDCPIFLFEYCQSVNGTGLGLEFRLLVAGGGGGAGQNRFGGHGGGDTGDYGQSSSTGGGGGGTQTAGGARGNATSYSNSQDGSAGGFGFGGRAASQGDPGGGGGGWYGGGGGAYYARSGTDYEAGGGGGSSHASSAFTNTDTQTGVRSGDGLVRITPL